MRRFLLLGLSLTLTASACRTYDPYGGYNAEGEYSSPRSASRFAGATTAMGAVRAFVDAASVGDLGALTRVWGGKEGSIRDRMDPDEAEMRARALSCLFQHETASYGREQRRAQGTVIPVTLNYHNLSVATTVTAVLGPKGRWYVETANVDPLQAICAAGKGEMGADRELEPIKKLAPKRVRVEIPSDSLTP